VKFTLTRQRRREKTNFAEPSSAVLYYSYCTYYRSTLYIINKKINQSLPLTANGTLYFIGRNPITLVHILGALHSRSGVAIRQVLRKLQSSSDFQVKGARTFAAVCGSAVVCRSAAVCRRAAVCARVRVWQCYSLQQRGSVWQCVRLCAVVRAAICGSVWQCVPVRAAMCGSALYVYIHKVTHNIFIGMLLLYRQGQWD
jgi:hypothetical protein